MSVKSRFRAKLNGAVASRKSELFTVLRVARNLVVKRTHARAPARPRARTPARPHARTPALHTLAHSAVLVHAGAAAPQAIDVLVEFEHKDAGVAKQHRAAQHQGDVRFYSR